MGDWSNFVDFALNFSLNYLILFQRSIIPSKNTAGGTSLSKPQTNKVLVLIILISRPLHEMCCVFTDFERKWSFFNSMADDSVIEFREESSIYTKKVAFHAREIQLSISNSNRERRCAISALISVNLDNLVQELYLNRSCISYSVQRRAKNRQLKTDLSNKVHLSLPKPIFCRHCCFLCKWITTTIREIRKKKKR